MKKVSGLLFALMLVGCSTPGKPAFYYPWTQYRTGIDINLPKEPKYDDSFHGTLRQDDDGEYAMIVIYNGGNVVSQFGYATKNTLESWISLYSGFLAWDPKDTGAKTRFTVPDTGSLTRKEYDIEYRLVQGKKLFVINKHSSDALFTDFSEMSMDEENVARALNVYENLRTALR
ncbi:hypothetical protein MXM41_00875 [Leclercia adecarboxylata]|uniref:hypothetical protein n=1 Tax=Leclercia adecarboxylata TaxID=83655 RepID=UPI002DBB5C2C|nr:hypothetical protein [Leclercia adecarboxylata]MEB6377499.1 hypothetical protein [Leclercia adecarboxylata]